MVSFIDRRSLPFLDADLVPESVLGVAVVPSGDGAPHAGVDVAVMHFDRWLRADGAALLLWNECWVGSPADVEQHLETAAPDDALLVGHDLFESGYPSIERLGTDVLRLVPATVDIGFEIAAQVQLENPYVSYRGHLGQTAAANSQGRIGATPSTSFDERFAEVDRTWRVALWGATLSVWLWTVMVGDQEVVLPGFGEKRVSFDAEDLDVLLGRAPRMDTTTWELRKLLELEAA